MSDEKLKLTVRFPWDEDCIFEADPNLTPNELLTFFSSTFKDNLKKYNCTKFIMNAIKLNNFASLHENGIYNNSTILLISDIPEKNTSIKPSINKDMNIYKYTEMLLKQNSSIPEHKKKELKEYETYFDLIINACGVKIEDIEPIGCNKDPHWEFEGSKRGGEKYYPPYGFVGIGLKCMGKYPNGDRWLTDNINGYCVCYHGVGHNNDKALEIVGKIIYGNFIAGTGQPYKDNDDLNHPGRKVGVGVYLNNNIFYAEQRASTLSSYKGVVYKPVLMVKVDHHIIKKPSGVPNEWVVEPEGKTIRPIRVLFKKI